jgi:hypothetical protein
MPFFPRSRRGGRRRRREDDSVHAIGFELDSLEFVQASDELGLLRVGGRWVAPVSRALGEMILTVRRDTETLALLPLPDMNGVAPVASPAGEEWRGAFTMTVELADDPRTEFALLAGDDAAIALPRPGEWDELQEEEQAEPELDVEPEPEPESPVAAELVAKLDEVARTEPEPEPEVSPAEPAELAELREEVDVLRAERDVLRAELAAARSELEATRGRSTTLEHELQSRASVEEDLRNAIATQEAELASAAAQASQRARQAERRRDLTPPRDGGDHPERPRSRPADEEFVARLERARRASEAATG